MANTDSDEFGDSDDDALVLAATQAEDVYRAGDEFEASPRPTKRARLQEQRNEQLYESLDGQDDRENTSWHDSDGSVSNDEYEANVTRQNDNYEIDAKSSKRPRYRIHEPSRNIDLGGRVFAEPQLPQSSQPWIIRGPIWKKANQAESTSSSFNPGPLARSEPEANISAAEGRQTELSASFVHDDSYEVADSQRAQTDNVSRELENLPSDAFISSSLNEMASGNPPSAYRNLRAPLNGLRQTTLFGRDGAAKAPAQPDKRHAWPLANKDEPKTHHELDPDSAKTWVYPTNIGKVRDYQFNIVARGLFHNLLVALPTGLGKTFIAATIMLNWYRWTKSAQIVFVAPTKPLVAQQVNACFHIAGIPWSDTSMLTGEVSAAVRREEWQTKRVFFLTPQTLVNDLKTGSADPKRIVLVVVDEAHRATGGYAYVEVVKFIRRFNESFRVLALTATPGADIEAVQKVIDGLDISRVEIRTENSLDIREYVHQRQVEKMVFQNSDEMVMLMDLYAKAVQPVLNVIVGMNAFWQRDPISLTPYGCTRALSQWMASDAGRHANVSVKAMVRSVFTNLASLSHSMELLKYHGIAPFSKCLVNFQREADTSKSKYKKQVIESEHFKTMTGRLKMWMNNPEFVGHPKLEALREVILNHLMDAGEGLQSNNTGTRESNTRIMVFAHFRDSAEDIARVLMRDSPLIRPHVFVGQASAKNSEGMTQKKQLSVIEDFKSGALNTLIATSIGEEGLDIGEVDLIICYDSKSSPLRMLQRMGRTGRKRAGKIVLFQMQGKEEDDAAKAKDAYEKMQELIANGDKFAFHEDRSRRILPREIQPEPDRISVVIPFENTQHRTDSLPVPTKKGTRRATKRPPKKFHMPDGVRTGFAVASELESQPLASKVDEAVVIPALNDVLLDPESMQDLTRRYQLANVEDEHDEGSSRPRLSRLTKQKDLGRTMAIPHGRVSKSLAGVLRRTHKVDDSTVQERRLYFDEEYLSPDDVSNLIDDANQQRDRDKPRKAIAATKSSDATHVRPPTKGRKIPSKRSAVEAFEAPSSSAVGTSPVMRLARSQAITLGSMDTPPPSTGQSDGSEERDSDLDDFIVDDDEPILEESSSLPSVDILETRSSGRAGPISDDLPDLGNILRSRTSNEIQISRQNESVPARKRRRRVASSGEDSDG